MCYTFNNYPQKYSAMLKQESVKNVLKFNSDDYISTRPPKETIRSVKGCGKRSGFQLIIDTQRLTNLIPKHHKLKGYQIHITLPGVMSSDIPYTIFPGEEREHNFAIHGIHKITVSLTLCFYLWYLGLLIFNLYSRKSFSYTQ